MHLKIRAFQGGMAVGGAERRLFDIRTNTWRYGSLLNFSTERVNAVKKTKEQVREIGK